ncbi:MAG: transglutaminaseTgpA domain-containing protein [Bdellovibrionia bacterium]
MNPVQTWKAIFQHPSLSSERSQPPKLLTPSLGLGVLIELWNLAGPSPWSVSTGVLGCLIFLQLMIRRKRFWISFQLSTLCILLLAFHSCVLIECDSPIFRWILLCLCFLDLGILFRVHFSDWDRKALVDVLQGILKSVFLTLPFFLILGLTLGLTHSIPSFFSHPWRNSEAISSVQPHLAPGTIQRLKLIARTDYQVQTQEALDPNQAYYWRVFTLDQSEGFRWWQMTPIAKTVMQDPTADPVSSCLVHQKVFTLNDSNHDPVGLDRLITWHPQASEPALAVSDLCPTPPTSPMSESDQKFYTQVDLKTRDELIPVIHKLRLDNATQTEVIQRVLNYFRTEKFKLTLQTQVQGLESSLSDFLLKTREGFCEHYAAAFSTLLRTQGIPSRVVVGYLGGRWNPWGKFWALSADEAHAWSEVWLQGNWHRIDPSAALSSSARPPRNELKLNVLFLLLEFIRFEIESQFHSVPHLPSKTSWCVGLLILLSLISALRFKRSRVQRQTNPQIRSLKTFEQLLDQMGQRISPRIQGEGYDHYRIRLAETLSGNKKFAPIESLFHEVFRLHLQIRYSSSPLEFDELKEFERKIKTLLFFLEPISKPSENRNGL